MPTWPLRVLLAAALATGPVQAQEIPPPAYQLAAQRAGIPSTVLYAVALQESGVRRDDRIVPWPWSLNVAGQSRRYATRAQACAGVRQALREVPPTRIDVGSTFGSKKSLGKEAFLEHSAGTHRLFSSLFGKRGPEAKGALVPAI